ATRMKLITGNKRAFEQLKKRRAKMVSSELKTDADILRLPENLRGDVKPKRTRRRKVKSVIRMTNEEYKTRGIRKSGIKPDEKLRRDVSIIDPTITREMATQAAQLGKEDLEIL